VLLERLRAHSREHALLKEEEEEYRLAQMETEEDKFEESRCVYASNLTSILLTKPQMETEEDKFEESRYNGEL
jgi:hypothetical protein